MARSTIAYASFFFLFVAILLLSHATVIDLPYFWDELGQFVPAALDIYYDGALIPRTTLPNVHPPGVMLYLAGVWKVFGYSVEATRLAMIVMAAAGVLCCFALAVHLGRPLGGFPAFTAVLFLLVSPLFYTQAAMAQLDMPAMTFTLLALVLFLRKQYAAAAAACVVLVLMKETALTTPAVFGAWLLWERRWKQALYFTAPAFALAAWLGYLHAGTGHILGNREFTHYNVAFQLHPVRLSLTLLRRLFYIFVDNFHVIGTIAIAGAWRRTPIFRTREWAITAAVAAAQTSVVTVFGGAALERYLLPVLPLFYIAAASALTTWRKRAARGMTAAMAAGLVIAMFVPSVFPYPYENNLAVFDFIRLQQQAASFVESTYPEKTIASAWPFPDAIRRPEFGYVSRPMKVRGLDNFDPATVMKLKVEPADVLVLYSRTWEPRLSVVRLEVIKRFLSRYYFYQPQITREEIEAELDMTRVMRFERGEQWVEVYVRSGMPNIMVL
jgi:hypothetical protein